MKKKEMLARDPLSEAITLINSSNPGEEKKSEDNSGDIVDIMTFCDDPKYLYLSNSNFNLWVPQRIILKSFYMGTRGNENLKLNKEEWEWLYANDKDEERDGIVYHKNTKEVIEKLLKKEKEGFNFTELSLCVGRRGTKTIISSIISAYEAYKLAVIGKGDPHKFYGIPNGEEILIINVALSQDQAGTLFGMIRQRIIDAPFFKGRKANETTTEIRIYTNKELRALKNGEKPMGSIKILCGHSNPDTLRGKSAVLILFDELAFYDETGKTPGSTFYNALEPSTKKFKKFGDARLVELSSPNTASGIFYDIHQSAKTANHVLSFQLPTWCVNMDIPYESLADERKRNIDNFIIEYGSQWAKSGIYGNYFPDGLVERCIRTDIGPHVRIYPNFNYYLHVDPALNGDRYVAVLVAKEYYHNHLGKRRIRVRLANVWMWLPEPGVGLLFNDIDKEVIEICGKYRPLAVSYDQWNCPMADEYLYTKRGIIKARDIVLGDVILSQNGAYNGVKNLRFKKDVAGYKIKTKFGYSLEANDIHPVYVKNVGFKKMKDLKTGDSVCLSENRYDFGLVNSPDEALMAGYIISEGYIGSKNNDVFRVGFTNTNKDVLMDYKNIATKITGKNPKAQDRYKNHKVWKSATTYNYGDKKSISIIMGFIGELKQYGSEYKTVPSFVMRGNKKTVSSFLSSLYEGDGHISLNPNVLNIEYDTTSEILAKEIQLLLLGFGIKSSLKYYTNKFFKGRRFPFYRVSLYGDNILIFNKEIGFRSRDKKSKIKKAVILQKSDKRSMYARKSRGLRKEKNKQTNRGRYMWDKIVSIEPKMIDIVNIEVDGDHTYISNGIISHNSVQSLQLLRSHGINAIQTSFNRTFKNKIYQNLKDMMSYQPHPELWLYDDHRLTLEMKALKFRPTMRGISLVTDKHGEIKTDDVVDCLAGAAAMASESVFAALPLTVSVYTGMR